MGFKMESLKSIKNSFLAFLLIIFLLFSVNFCFGASGNVAVNLDFFHLSINSPQAVVYSFGVGESPVINLSVSADREGSFWYTLRDVINNQVIYGNTIFTTNTTFVAVSGLNLLTVYANDSAGNIINRSVTFSVLSANSAPVIQGINSSIYVCEGNYLSYFFNVTDAEGNDIDSTISPTYPSSPFYITKAYDFNSTTSFHEIFSGNLLKGDAGGPNAGYKTYVENVSVSDGEYEDIESINITLIEINNAPVMEVISTQTVVTGNVFYKQIRVNDTESGNETSNNLTFNISFNSGTHLFNISSLGVINFTTNSSFIGNHNITVCAIDSGIISPHVNISSLCGQEGDGLSVCKNFLFVINSTPTNVKTVSGGGGGGGGGSSLILNNLVSANPNSFNISLKKGESVKKILKIKNNLNKTIDFHISVTDSLKNFVFVSDKGFTINPLEEKTIIVIFFSPENIESSTYTGKIIINGENSIKELPVVLTINDKKSLFDVKLNVFDNNMFVNYGKKLSFDINIINIGETELVDTVIEYYVKDFDGNLLFTRKENVTINTSVSLSREILFLKNLHPGKYVLGVNVKYGDITGVSSMIFSVNRLDVTFYILSTVFIVILVFVFIYLIIKYFALKKSFIHIALNKKSIAQKKNLK